MAQGKKKHKCKVCNSKRVVQINKKIRNGESLSSIEATYGISRSTLRKHKLNCMNALLTDQITQMEKSDKDDLIGEVLVKQVRSQIDLVHKLVEACDEWLTDPDDPEKYFLGARGDEVDIVYQEVDEATGRLLPSRQKATLQECIQKVASDGFIIRGITNKHADPRELLLKAIAKLESTVKMINESTQNLIEWEHKKNALDKLSTEGGEISFEKQVNTIVERVTIAVKGSNTKELCKAAGLPKLK